MTMDLITMSRDPSVEDDWVSEDEETIKKLRAKAKAKPKKNDVKDYEAIERHNVSAADFNCNLDYFIIDFSNFYL